jgi:hypothetical protein
MISLHWSHIATRQGACLILKNLFSFINFKYLSFSIVLFACERIPAMGAPSAIFEGKWQNPPRGRRCVEGRYKIFENSLNAARRRMSIHSFFTSFV